jgi:monoamine oxidase
MRDVIIVGAGFCGLSAAQWLVARGVDAVVIEARERVGGRVEARENALGERIDTGGQFLCEDMPQIMALARRKGRRLVEAWADGSVVTQPSMPEEDAERVYAETGTIRLRLRDLDPADPAIRRLSVADWLARQPEDRDARNAFRSTIEGLWCQPIDRVPLWYLADNDRRITNRVSELQLFPVDTMHAMAADIAAELGDRVRLAEPAERIERDEAGVRVLTERGQWRARCAIVAVPPVAASRIAHSPALPDPLRQALGAWSSGTVVKMRLRYDKPFWRERGLCGMVVWLQPHGLFACDSSSDADHAALTVFVGGPLAVAWAPLGETGLEEEVLRRLVAALGPKAGAPIDISPRDWTDDRWSGGGYSDVIVDLDARDAEATLREGVWPVFFAASELSPSFPGYVEGAIVAGRLVAERALAALSQSPIATSASGS